jgi:hypothetical protein
MEKNRLPFAYMRGKRIMAVNPSSKETAAYIGEESREVLWSVGTGSLNGGILTVGPQSFVVF